MTRTALSQLDLKRKSLLIRSLYDARLITLQASSRIGQLETILEFRQIDLSSVTFGPFSYSQEIFPFHHYVEWNYLTLPFGILVNASFHHTHLHCALFHSAKMDSADLSFITQRKPICFDIPRSSNTIFFQASLVNASFYRSTFYNTDFGLADMTNANMTNFYCRECHFYSTKLVQVELSFSKIFNVFDFTSYRLNFYAANLKGSTMHSTLFNSVNFDQSNWSDVQASEIHIRNSTFNGTMMENCSLVQGFIFFSEFENANLSNINLSQATFYNVSFLDVNMRNGNLSSMKCTYCYFTNVTFEGVTFKNASFHYSVFLNCLINDHQLAETFELTGSTLPNGTVVGTNA